MINLQLTWIYTQICFYWNELYKIVITSKTLKITGRFRHSDISSDTLSLCPNMSLMVIHVSYLFQDAIIVVNDVSHPDYEWQHETVHQTLKSLSLPPRLSDNIIEIDNKVDLMERFVVLGHCAVKFMAMRLCILELWDVSCFITVINKHLIKNQIKSLNIL